MASTEDYINDHIARHRDGSFLAAFGKLADEPDAPGPLPASDHDAHCTHRIVLDSGKVFVLHPCYVELIMQIGLFTATFKINGGHAGIDHVLQLVTHYAGRWEYNPMIYVFPSVNPLPDDALCNQLRIDLDPTTELGAIACTMERGPSPGTWFTQTDNTADLPAPRLVWDYCNGGEAAFPPDAAVPLDGLRRAVHEFYDLNGAGLPSCLNWQKAPETIW